MTSLATYHTTFCHRHKCISNVTLLAGKKDFHAEQLKLVRERPHADVNERWCSVADIVVATKGRLLDHIDRTPGFDLTHLRFLVTLLAGKKDFHAEQLKLVRERPHADVNEKWCSVADIVVATKGRLLDHIDRTPGFDLTHLRFLVIDEADRQMEDIYDDWLTQVESAAYTPKPFTYSPYHRPKPSPLTVASSQSTVMHMQKLLFSATLSQNPEKLEQMNLHLPLLFAAVAPGTAGGSAERLTTGGELICSDMMTRGMDIGNVEYVISYDSPPYIETYIHRVGRTARANRPGTAITMLEGKEVYHFKKMLRDSGRWRKLKRIYVNQKSLQPLVSTYTEALRILPEILTLAGKAQATNKSPSRHAIPWHVFQFYNVFFAVAISASSFPLNIIFGLPLAM
ncbi:ATP-dependent RNA helicase DDX51 [Elysia marginata]|uniref:ATP-dependent RNA helicase n=1 Tax=Elysia marginata TaxID=1093978 RepID=A0AAV4JVY8_9GAST|nr:ATP-dependent RNA helicase DDX51 [Elysia marginata]